MNQVKFFVITIAIILVLACAVSVALSWAATEEEIKQEKIEISKMAKETLARLYKLQPSAKKAVSESAGYTVFSNFGTKIFIVGGGGEKA